MYVCNMLVNILGDRDGASWGKSTLPHTCIFIQVCVCVCILFFYVGQIVNVFKLEYIGYVGLSIFRWGLSTLSFHILLKK
jgi:hypothetical protein